MPPPTFRLAACKHLQYLLKINTKRTGNTSKAHTSAKGASFGRKETGSARLISVALRTEFDTARPKPVDIDRCVSQSDLSYLLTRANRLVVRSVRHVYWPRTAAIHGQPTP